VVDGGRASKPWRFHHSTNSHLTLTSQRDPVLKPHWETKTHPVALGVASAISVNRRIYAARSPRARHDMVLPIVDHVLFRSLSGGSWRPANCFWNSSAVPLLNSVARLTAAAPAASRPLTVSRHDYGHGVAPQATSRNFRIILGVFAPQESRDDTRIL
jgi:hypothetical protein